LSEICQPPRERPQLETDGSVEACRTSNPDSPTPPTECRSPISVQLLPLAGAFPKKVEKHAPATGEKPDAPPPKDAKAAKEKEATPQQSPCPPGYIHSGGICSSHAETSHLCKPDDDADCKAQCEKGSAESCFNHAAGKALAPKDREAAYKKACEGGYAEGCGYAGLARWDSDNLAERQAEAGIDPAAAKPGDKPKPKPKGKPKKK
jgi:uncharacterized protein